MQFGVIVSLVCLPLLTQGNVYQKPSFCEDRECPPFAEIETSSDAYEIREYVASKWVYSDYGAGGESPFAQLYQYLQGVNDQGATFSLAVPVLKVSRGGGVKSLMFYLNVTTNNSPPSPSNNNVHLMSFPQTQFYVKVFNTTTMPADSEFNAQLVTLKNDIGDTALYNTTVDIYASYKSPYYVGERQNEVWLVKV